MSKDLDGKQLELWPEWPELVAIPGPPAAAATASWWGLQIPTTPPAQLVIPEPKTKAEADALRAAIGALPEPVLAKLYVDLHDAHNLRLDSARRKAADWYNSLA
jgi:hypothetical protein